MRLSVFPLCIAVLTSGTAARAGAAPGPAAAPRPSLLADPHGASSALAGDGGRSALARLAIVPPPPPPGGRSLGVVQESAGEARADGWRRAALPAVESLGVNLAMMAWNRWPGAAPWADISADSIGRNLQHSWVLDDDAFWVNQFGHPYQGTWAQTAARSAGLGFWPSAAYPVVASALWEVAGETTAPSINDQITTPVAGIVLGEVLFRVSDALRASGGPWRTALADVLAPMSRVNAPLVRRAPRPAPSSRVVLAAGALGGDAARSPLPAAHGWAGLELTWGVPGDPELRLDGPFDHFVLDAGYGAARDPVATVRGRGLLAGELLERGSSVRGVWGLWLCFDFDTPGDHRISTSALAVGASGRAELGPDVAVEATALGGPVLMGAAGLVDLGRPDSEGRDYRFGPGAQSLLELRLLAARLTAGVTVRQYLIVGDGPGSGLELLVAATAGARLRFVGPHGLGADWTEHLRRSEDLGGPAAWERGGVLRVYYAFEAG